MWTVEYCAPLFVPFEHTHSAAGWATAEISSLHENRNPIPFSRERRAQVWRKRSVGGWFTRGRRRRVNKFYFCDALPVAISGAHTYASFFWLDLFSSSMLRSLTGGRKYWRDRSVKERNVCASTTGNFCHKLVVQGMFLQWRVEIVIIWGFLTPYLWCLWTTASFM